MYGLYSIVYIMHACHGNSNERPVPNVNNVQYSNTAIKACCIS